MADNHGVYWFLLPLLMQVCIASEGERQLIASLLSGYDSNVRPVEDPQKPVDVSISLSLKQIINLDEKNQVLTALVYRRLHWHDHHLQWTPENYSNVQSIHLTVSRIWRPDIILQNDVGSGQSKPESSFPVSVQHTGKVSWLTPLIYNFWCELDLTDFPFDSQSCDMQFESWTHDSDSLDLVNISDSGDTDFFVPNGEWTLESLPVRHRYFEYSCITCTVPFANVIFTVNIQRKPLYYVFHLIAPCICITLVALTVFWLPVESGEKMSLSITALLASTVFLLIVADTLPTQSTVIPLIGYYFGSTMVVLTLCTVCSMLVLNVYHRGATQQPVPQWAATILCLSQIRKYCSGKRQNPHPEDSVETELTNSVQGRKAAQKLLEPELSFAEQWAELARALDMFFFLLFSLVTFGTILLIFCSA